MLQSAVRVPMSNITSSTQQVYNWHLDLVATSNILFNPCFSGSSKQTKTPVKCDKTGLHLDSLSFMIINYRVI